VSENVKKPDHEKLKELYEDWYGADRDPDRAFRVRFITVEKWVKNQMEAAELKKAEEKGRRFLTDQLAQLLKFIGVGGVITLIGLIIRLYNSWQGGTP